MKTVAVMQPYFIPSAGYFRLFAHADEVVMLEDVQFPRRGFVHRNRLRGADGRLGWLTLPLARAPVTTEVRRIEFAPGARTELSRRLRRFRPAGTGGPGTEILLDALPAVDEQTAVDFIIGLLTRICAHLGLPVPSIRSSELALPGELRGQDRIIAIARARGADTYLNLPGGRSLYQASAFAGAGLELAFLPPFDGPGESICERLDRASADHVLGEIRG